MSLRQELLEVEELLWTGGGDAYRETLLDEALLIVPHQVLDKGETVAAIEAAARWDEVRFEDPNVVPLGADAAVVSYKGVGNQGDVIYEALVSSTYVRRDGAWRLAFHHQTPLPEVAG